MLLQASGVLRIASHRTANGMSSRFFTVISLNLPFALSPSQTLQTLHSSARPRLDTRPLQQQEPTGSVKNPTLLPTVYILDELVL